MLFPFVIMLYHAAGIGSPNYHIFDIHSADLLRTPASSDAFWRSISSDQPYPPNMDALHLIFPSNGAPNQRCKYGILRHPFCRSPTSPCVFIMHHQYGTPIWITKSGRPNVGIPIWKTKRWHTKFWRPNLDLVYQNQAFSKFFLFDIHSADLLPPPVFL